MLGGENNVIDDCFQLLEDHRYLVPDAPQSNRFEWLIILSVYLRKKTTLKMAPLRLFESDKQKIYTAKPTEQCCQDCPKAWGWQEIQPSLVVY